MAELSDPTPPQMRVLRTIVEYRAARGYAPTQRELADRLGRTVSHVQRMIEGLRVRGLIIDHAGRHRNAVPTQRGTELARMVETE